MSKKSTTERDLWAYDSWPDWLKLVISLATEVVLCLIVYFFNVPNPNMILITGLVVATSLFGYIGGIPCVAVMMIYSMFFFSTDHSFYRYTAVNGQKLVIIFLGSAITLLFVGQLKQRQRALMDRLRDVNQMLAEDNRMLEKASMVDALTGVRNRFALRRDYPRYESGDLTVLMMDVDSFKEINDQHGHETGDHVLSYLGKLIGEVFGQEGCYRYGGDEFLVIRQEIDVEGFEKLTAQLSEKLTEFRLHDAPFSLSVSGGYVYGTAELPSDLRTMIQHADRRLYESKFQGKGGFIGARFRRSFAEQLGRM